MVPHIMMKDCRNLISFKRALSFINRVSIYMCIQIRMKDDIGTIILNLAKVSSLLTPSTSFQRLSNYYYIQARTLMINCSVSSVNNINLPLR